jgi:hypothetical protein
VCDTSQGAGECVQCTGVQDDACAVGGKDYVCDSLNRTCAAAVPENEVGSAGVCDACLSDAHCATGRVCVEAEFQGQTVPGWVCLWQQGGDGGAPTECASGPRPYTNLFINVTSIDDQENLSVCGLRSTTCAALRDITKACDPNGDECGLPGVDDGRCEDQDGFQCTIPCNGTADCPPTGATCDTSGFYCTL